MQLGTFSVSLTVKDISISRAFYEKLGFAAFAGVADEGWLIMRNGNATVGLFQGMFDKNILTFNPGWSENAETLDSFTDIRELQKQLRARGIPLHSEVDENTAGPANIMVVDPDGNPILIDQHV